MKFEQTRNVLNANIFQKNTIHEIYFRITSKDSTETNPSHFQFISRYSGSEKLNHHLPLADTPLLFEPRTTTT